MYKILLSFLGFFMVACIGKTVRSNDVTGDSSISKLETDTIKNEIIYVPEELKEISGITFVNDSLIAAIEDEHGILYFFDLNKKEIVKKYNFSDDGDYEDLVRVNDTMYVVESNGTIFEIKDFDSKNPKVEKYKTDLNSKNDIEGITFDSKRQALLLSVKEKNMKRDGSDELEKDIYAFDLKSKKLLEVPVIKIDLKEIEDLYKGSKLEEASKKLLEALGNENLKDIIKPSGLSFNPLTHELYVLSSINHIIVVLSQDGKFKRVVPFFGKAFSQPEGISFNSKGDLYISNEGRNKAGNIIKIQN